MKRELNNEQFVQDNKSVIPAFARMTKNSIDIFLN